MGFFHLENSITENNYQPEHIKITCCLEALVALKIKSHGQIKQAQTNGESSHKIFDYVQISARVSLHVLLRGAK